MAAQVHVLADPVDSPCDATCYNTNIFAPGGYKVRCDACRGRRGHYDKEDRWIDCRNCAGAGSVCCPRCHGSGKIALD